MSGRDPRRLLLSLTIFRRSKSHESKGLILTALLLAFIGATLEIRGVRADDWQPISPDELKMTSVPEAPGAPAVILYRQVDRDDNAKTGSEQNYVRIKILTEEGRKYADVEIPYFREQGNIVGIRARTVRPDGGIVNFEGKAYDKTIVKARESSTWQRHSRCRMCRWAASSNTVTRTT